MKRTSSGFLVFSKLYHSWHCYSFASYERFSFLFFRYLESEENNYVMDNRIYRNTSAQRKNLPFHPYTTFFSRINLVFCFFEHPSPIRIISKKGKEFTDSAICLIGIFLCIPSYFSWNNAPFSSKIDVLNVRVHLSLTLLASVE